MTITRLGTTPRWSDVVTHGQLAFFCEVASDLEADIAGQTAQVLQTLQQRLRDVGSSSAQLLMATIYLPHRADLPVFNALWEAWLPAGGAPVRCCLHAELTDARMRVEIQLIAAIAA